MWANFYLPCVIDTPEAKVNKDNWPNACNGTSTDMRVDTHTGIPSLNSAEGSSMKNKHPASNVKAYTTTGAQKTGTPHDKLVFTIIRDENKMPKNTTKLSIPNL